MGSVILKVKEKLRLDYEGLINNGPINIVAFGDSVTHGALNGEIDFETVYWNVLRKMLVKHKCYVPINVINAGIGGITAKTSIDRIDRDVLSHNPDLIIICFGLNDVNYSLEEYIESMEIIFSRCVAKCEQVIFMTPNMLNTYVADDTLDRYKRYAAITAEYQNSGKLDTFINEAISLAKRHGVTVCDVYAYWKKLADSGEDTTNLLINRINHPTREMHKKSAEMLFDIIIDEKNKTNSNEDLMFKYEK